MDVLFMFYHIMHVVNCVSPQKYIDRKSFHQKWSTTFLILCAGHIGSTWADVLRRMI